VIPPREGAAAAAAAATTTTAAQRLLVSTWILELNIGACVMQVFVTRGASVAAFEPNPSNLFRLSSRLLNLPEDLKSRVTLFPVTLGDEPVSFFVDRGQPFERREHPSTTVGR
jgi:hypothetical protein